MIMPKMKTNQAASKRFKKTKNGKFKRFQMGTRHLKTAKSQKRIRNLRQSSLVHESEAARVQRMLPYA